MVSTGGRNGKGGRSRVAFLWHIISIIINHTIRNPQHHLFQISAIYIQRFKRLSAAGQTGPGNRSKVETPVLMCKQSVGNGMNLSTGKSGVICFESFLRLVSMRIDKSRPRCPLGERNTCNDEIRSFSIFHFDLLLFFCRKSVGCDGIRGMFI